MKWHSIETPEGEKRVASVRTPKGVWVSYRGRSYFVQNDSEVKTISVSKVFNTIVENL